jgi:hypothetical protein
LDQERVRHEQQQAVVGQERDEREKTDLRLL